MKAIPKPKRIQDAARLDFVRKMSCLIVAYGGEDDNVHRHRTSCVTYWALGLQNTEPCEAHHVRRGAKSGVGTKPNDDRTVPLCRAAHDDYHRIGHDAFERKYGLDLEEHIARINREYAKRNKPKARTRRVQQPYVKELLIRCDGHTHKIPAVHAQMKNGGFMYWCSIGKVYKEAKMKG